MGKAKEGLKPEHKIFAHEYVFDWNGTRAYQKAYPDSSYDAARSSASTLLTNPNINAYIEEIQKDLGKLSGVSALMNVLELKKIAFTNLSDFKDGWMTERDFDALDEDTKAALSEIQYTEKTHEKHGTERIVKFKLHDKQKAIESLNKMLGFNAPEKSEIDINDNLSEEDRIRRILELKNKLNGDN